MKRRCEICGITQTHPDYLWRQVDYNISHITKLTCPACYEKARKNPILFTPLGSIEMTEPEEAEEVRRQAREAIRQAIETAWEDFSGKQTWGDFKTKVANLILSLASENWKLAIVKPRVSPAGFCRIIWPLAEDSILPKTDASDTTKGG